MREFDFAKINSWQIFFLGLKKKICFWNSFAKVNKGLIIWTKTKTYKNPLIKNLSSNSKINTCEIWDIPSRNFCFSFKNISYNSGVNLNVLSQPAFTCSKVNTRTMCEICSKLTIKTPERRYWRYFTPCSSIFIVNFEHVIVGWVYSFSLCFFRKLNL